MKRILVILAAILLYGTTSNAQETAITDSNYNLSGFVYEGSKRENFNEISLSIGSFSLNSITLSPVSIILAPFIGKADSKWWLSKLLPLIPEISSNESLSGFLTSSTFNTGYLRYLSNGRFAFGSQLIYQFSTVLYTATPSNTDKYTKNMHYISVMPSIRIFWFNRKHVGMYTNAGGGAQFIASNQFAVLPAFQIDAVCVDFGGKYVRGYVETGFGTQGILKFGVKTCF